MRNAPATPSFMPLDVGDQREIQLTDLTNSGAALGRVDGVVTFVHRGAPGDIACVEITEKKKRHLAAKIKKLISPAPGRTVPRCPYFVAGCGGCQWQHVNYHAQMTWKKRLLVESVKRIGKLTEVPSPELHPTAEPLGYRNKIRLAISSTRSQIEFGFNEEGSHTVVPISYCEIAHPAINRSLPQVSELISRRPSSRPEECIVQTSTTTGEVMLTLIFPKHHKPQLGSLREDFGDYPALKSLFVRNGKKGKIGWVAGKRTISETLGGISYEIGPETFFQSNVVGLAKLMEIVGQQVVSIAPSFCIDAHCGVGTFTLMISQFVQSAIGLDVQPQSVLLARKNARWNRMGNVSFRAGNIGKLNRVEADLILLNPPRGGCWSEDIEAVKSIGPPHILYISCNPTTLARDLSQLNENYEVCSLNLVDLFPMTYHFETVAWLCKR